MSIITGVIAAAAAKAGATLVGKAVAGVFGEKGGALAESVVTSVAEQLGVEPESIPDQPPIAIQEAVVDVERLMPEMIALWGKGLDGQFALLQAETSEGPLQSGWRWGWMYLLALFWTCYIIVFPAMSLGGFHIERVDLAILLTLTTWFISLYMGGHTVKALGESAIAAVNSWRSRK